MNDLYDFIKELRDAGLTLAEFCAKSDHTEEEVVRYQGDPIAQRYLKRVLANVLAV